jgi:hypothetical protein
LFPNGEEMPMDGKGENLALEDVAILWSKRVKVGDKTRQNPLVNLVSSLAYSPQFILS